MVDVVDCPGCCDGPCRTTITFNDWRDLDTPGLMNTVSRSYLLEVDEPLDVDRLQPQFDVCSGQRFTLGDYGDYSPGNFVCTGNIFEDMPTIGLDRKDPAYCPTAFNLPCPGLGILMDRVKFGDDFTLAYRHMDTSLALRQPKRISLPANEHVSLLLKALSTRLAGKYLVTTLIQCSDFYTVDKDGNRWGSSDGESSTNSGALFTFFLEFHQTPHRPTVTTSQKQGFRRHFARSHHRKFGGENAFVNREWNTSKVSGSTLTRLWICLPINRRKTWRSSSFPTCSVSSI
ncbi:hypothetical protein EDD15DRAFT_2236604 [Pisolithus albus]|nr:hypothetical protein EDD15DRAFT_2236604 [Pisolithus albus]